MVGPISSTVVPTPSRLRMVPGCIPAIVPRTMCRWVPRIALEVSLTTRRSDPVPRLVDVDEPCISYVVKDYRFHRVRSSPSFAQYKAKPRRSGAILTSSTRYDVLRALCLLFVLALGELLDDLGVKRFQVTGVAARDETVVGNDLLIDPVTTRVLDIRLDAREGG